MAYSHLTAQERCQINLLLGLGCSLTSIARQLHRAPSTISREVRRNSNPAEFYNFGSAVAKARRRRAEGRPLRLEDPLLGAAVWGCLEEGWSPEQTAHRLRNSATPIRIGVRTIYRYIARLRSSHDPMLRVLPRCPRKRRKKRPMRQGRARLGGRAIDQRPADAADRTQPGHWEGDTLVATTGIPAIVTYVERASRFLIARKLPAKGSGALAQASIRAFKEHGRKKRRRTITLDNGHEFAGHREIERALKARVYFAQPHSPWQRPSVENTNGLIRHYLPKKTDLRKVTQTQLNRIVRSLNDRPRKCLNWRTPAEVFRSD
jgi:transposase, IS30 family